MLKFQNDYTTIIATFEDFPLPICKSGRTRYCRSFRTDGENYGRCSSKKETYFGFKVHALITLEDYIMAFEITPASVDDPKDLRDFAEHCLGLVILGDKGYTGEVLFEDMCMVFNSIFRERCDIGKIKQLIF